MRKLQSRIIAISIICTLIFSLLIGAVTFIASNRIIDNDAYLIMENKCESEKEKVNIILESVEQTVNIMSNIAIKEFQKGNDLLNNKENLNAYNEKMARLFVEMSEHTEAVLTLYYRYNIDLFGPTEGFWYGYENGTIVEKPTTNLSLFDKYDIQNSAWYYIPYENGKASWIEPYYNKSLEVYVLSYATPIYNNGIFIGVIGLEVDFSKITNIVSNIEGVEGQQAYIVNKYNQITYHKDLSYKSDRPIALKDYIEVEKILKNDMRLVMKAPKNEISSTASIWLKISTANIWITFVLINLLMTFFAIKLCMPLNSLKEQAQNITNGNYNVNITHNIEDTEEIEEISKSLNTLINELNDKQDYVNKLAFVDNLTGVYNNTAYVNHCLRINKNINNRKFAVVVLHFINLIPLNERFGREMGNEFLLSATQFIESVFNKSNIYRITGGLFTIILEDSEYERKEYLFKTFIEELKNQSIMIEQEEINIPIAIGIAEYNKHKDKTIEDVYNRADKFMQANKEKLKEE